MVNPVLVASRLPRLGPQIQRHAPAKARPTQNLDVSMKPPPVESPLNAHWRPDIERIIGWTLRDDSEDELGQGLREVEQDMVEVIAEFEGEL